MSKKAIVHGKSQTHPHQYSSLAEMLVYISEKFPKHGMTFVNYSGQEEFISYLDLVANAKKYLQGLLEKGIKTGDLLILAINDPKEFYNIFWACILGGIIVAPITPPKSFGKDSDTLHKLHNVWNLLQKPTIVIEEKYRKYYQPLIETDFENLNLLSTTEFVSNKEASIYKANPTDLAILQFSSGSTGLPKGVMLNHKNIILNLMAIQESYVLDQNDIVFTWLPHTHDMGLFCQYLSSIIIGANLYIFSPTTFIRSPYLFLNKITEHRGTWFGSPDFAFDWIVKNVSDDKIAHLDLSSLRFVLNGSEPISVQSLQTFVDKFAPCGFTKDKIRIAYGMAEVTVCATITNLYEEAKIESIDRLKLLNAETAISLDPNDKNSIKFVHAGHPIDGISIRIVDEKGNTLIENRVGQIQIKGSSVTSGYYNCPDLTKQLFDGEWIRTGDLGFIVDGSLVITGRNKDIIFVRGENYFAHDLEQAIFNHDIIQRGDLLILGLFNYKIQREELLVFIKHRSGVKSLLPVRQKIIDRLRKSLGLEVTHVIPLDHIPKTTSGKLKRFQLQKRYEEGRYDKVINEIKKYNEQNQVECNSSVPSCDELKINLYRIWAKILNISENAISQDDEFFALGGNSLKAFQLLSEIEIYLNRDIDAEILVACKTIRQLIAYLQSPNPSSNPDASDKQHNNAIDQEKAVAITGMALRFPSANNQDEFWNNLVSNKDSISKISTRRKRLAEDADWNDWLGELDNIDYFDNEFFDITPEQAIFMDPQQRIVLEVSYEALDDAGLLPGLDEERNIGVYSGVSSNTYYQVLVNFLKKNGINKLHQHSLVGNLNNMISAVLSRSYNFTGPSLAIDTACSSFLVALHHAVLALRQKTIEGAVVVGANILVDSLVHTLSHKAGFLSPNKHAKVFDKDADGAVLGEGIVVFYLESLSKAIQANKNIYGIIRGTAICNDGSSFGIMAPNPKGQYKVIRDAYLDANLSPNEIDYIEVHGTGTTIGDPIEVNVLSKLFSGHCDNNDHRVGIGSVKTNIGHLLSAAGGAGLAKILLCLKHKQLVPSLHLENLNPALKLEKSPFYVVQEVQSWQTKEPITRKAGLSSFGLGGTNAHIILEEWIDESKFENDKPLHLLTLSAKSEKALHALIYQTKEMLENEKNFNINNFCYTRNRYRMHYTFRSAFLISKNHQIINTFQAINPSINKRAIKIGIVIDEINYNNDLNYSDLSETDLKMIKFELENKGIESNQYKINCLYNFVYWYLFINYLKKHIKNAIQILGINSGEILSDLLNEKINLSQAVELFFNKKNGRENINSDTHFKDRMTDSKFDLLITLSSLKKPLLEILSNIDFDKIKIFNLKSDITNSFDLNRLSLMGELYSHGANFDWPSIYQNDSGRVISLPSYPFDRKSYWLNHIEKEMNLIID